MKILHFIPEWSLGGAERVVDEICKGFNNESKVVTFKIKQDSLHDCQIDVMRANGKIKKIISFLRYIRNENPSVIHGHMTPSIPYLIIARLFIRKSKIIYTVHGEYNLPKSKLAYYVDLFFYTKLKVKVVCVSDFSYNSIEKYWKIPKIVVFNGISVHKESSRNYLESDTDFMTLIKDKKVLITIARIVPVKNLELMIKAFCKLNNEYKAILVIIGYDPTSLNCELKKLKSYANDNVYFLGGKNNGIDYLRYADAYCISSISEALPISLIEAQQNKLPILGTNVGGIPEIVQDNFNGFLSIDMEVESYKDILERFIILDEDAILKLRKNAYLSYENLFDARLMVNKYKSLYFDGI